MKLSPQFADIGTSVLWRCVINSGEMDGWFEGILSGEATPARVIRREEGA
jgi:hypothetical protein